jgi:hypothetical protein
MDCTSVSSSRNAASLQSNPGSSVQQGRGRDGDLLPLRWILSLHGGTLHPGLICKYIM